MNNTEEVRDIIIAFLVGLDLNMESFYNTDDPSDYYSGNPDDDIGHGFDAGVNACECNLYHELKDVMDLSSILFAYDNPKQGDK